MKIPRMSHVILVWWLVLSVAAPTCLPAQQTGGAPVFKPEQLEQIVAPIALYPDARVLHPILLHLLERVHVVLPQKRVAVLPSGIALDDFERSFDAERDGFWTVSVDGRVEASVAIDGSHSSSEGAHLRWFIVSETLRGHGTGGRLISEAMAFCREHGYRSVYLWTFEGLDAARYLYEREGFVLTAEQRGRQWGTEVLEQRFDCSLPSAAHGL